MTFYGKIQARCASEDIPHTRWSDCDLKIGITKAILITPLNFTFPVTDSEAMMQALKQGVLSGRVFPIYGVTGQPLTGGEAATASTSHGPSIYVGETASAVSYEFATLGACASKQLKYFSLKNMRIVRIDVNDVVWGNAISDTVGRGYEAQLFHRDTEPTTETEAYVNYLEATYTSNYAREKWNRFALEALGDISGLAGVTLVAGATAGQARIVNACSGKDEGVEIAAMLDGSDAKALLVNDAGVNPTAATIDPDTGLITGITPTASYRIVSAAVLDSLNVVGYDGIKKLVDLTGNPDA